MENDRPRGDMYEILPGDGLHVLKGKFQKRFLAKQCTALTGCLVQAVEATHVAAPVRKNPYVIERLYGRDRLAHDEARWEEALFRQWKEPQQDKSVPWRRLLTYQVNLPNKKADPDWGEIDLLGVSHRGLPLVIELKAPRSSQSPVQMLVQAAAYGVALRKAWAAQCFRDEWERLVTRGETRLPDDLSTCELVCAAPTEYWANWTGTTPRARTVRPESWAALRTLGEALTGHGFPSVFVRLGHSGTDALGLPTGITVAEERLPD